MRDDEEKDVLQTISENQVLDKLDQTAHALNIQIKK